MLNKKVIGEKIRQARAVKGLSQTELGKLIEKSHAAVSDIERGKTEITVKDLSLISNRLIVPIEFFLNIEDSLSNHHSSGGLALSRDSKNSSIEDVANARKSEEEFKKRVEALSPETDPS